MRPAIASGAIVLGLTSLASGDVIAYWNFNSLSGSAPATIASDFGSGTILLDGSNGSSDWSTVTGSTNAFGGTTTNALFGDISGNAFCPVGSAANGFSFVFAIDMSNYSDLDISYATRGTGTGFSSQAWEYSTDGVNFTAAETIASQMTSSWVTKSLATITGLDGAATAFLRVTMTGATSTNGNNRFDNVVFDAAPSTPVVPGPAAIAALSAMAGMPRRRR
jgi:hypothetical protein